MICDSFQSVKVCKSNAVCFFSPFQSHWVRVPMAIVVHLVHCFSCMARRAASVRNCSSARTWKLFASLSYRHGRGTACARHGMVRQGFESKNTSHSMQSTQLSPCGWFLVRQRTSGFHACALHEEYSAHDCQECIVPSQHNAQFRSEKGCRF